MRIFVAGASGVIGSRLVPLLVKDGHEVTGMTRSPEKTESLERLGAQPVVCDAYDGDRLTEAVVGSRPEVVFDELTDLPDDAADLDRYHPRNDRMREEGSRNVLAAAAASGAPLLISQSIAWELAQERRRRAVADHERAVLEQGGVVIRYGQLYGPGTFYEDEPPRPPKIQVDDAARLTLRALDAKPGTTLVIEDNDGADGPSEGTIHDLGTSGHA